MGTNETKYILYGATIARDWYGHLGWIDLEITTNEKGLEEIRKNPLQDYISFGVAAVEYAVFDVFKKEIKNTDEKEVTIFYKTPIEHIEKGEIPEKIREDFLDRKAIEVVKITY